MPKCSIFMKSQGSKEYQDEDNPIYPLDDTVFEAMSMRVWTDVLLQIYKVRWACLYIEWN